MRPFHVFVRWLLGLARVLPFTAGRPDMYSKEWEERGIPGDGL